MSVKNILVKYFILLLFIAFAASVIVEGVNTHSVDKVLQDMQSLQASVVSFYQKPARPPLSVASLLRSGVVPESLVITAQSGAKALIADAWGGAYSVGPATLPVRETKQGDLYYFIAADQVPTQVCESLVEKIKGFKSVQIGDASALPIAGYYSKSGRQKIATDCVQQGASGGTSVRFVFAVK